MKKVFLAIVLAASSFVASAQTQTKFGIKGGVNFANVHLSTEGSSTSANAGNLTSFSAGLFADVQVSEGFSIQPALLYSGKGFKISQTATATFESVNVNAESKLKTKLNYIQVPVNFLYNSRTNAGNFFIGGGPFAAVAVSAHYKGYVYGSGTDGQNTVEQREDMDEKIEIGKDSGIKRMDYGITGLAGFRFNNNLSLNVNYDLGLANINNGDDTKMKTRVIGVSIGYSF
ncbi:PorT family protein [Mucilaginibacter sp. Bleaf8]|uniref:porin family protein n=1 Tax=Mucilaginibacter sp. Bleaf8 TaxID=2834430 RepID=UPI001BCB21FB|nr:porin family protein [Mucilaginibacter sp. Bleaf8]MBS7563546.1 PorT family protein [Mucilaginibacter sp. Bleaf8]